MLLYLSLVRAIMGCSNPALEISCRERSPDNSSMASLGPPPPPHPPISCYGKTGCTVQISSIWGGGWRIMDVPSILYSYTSDQANLDHLIAVHRRPHFYCPHHSQILGAAEQSGMAFSLPTKSRATNGSLTRTQSLGPLILPQKGLHCLRAGFLNLNIIIILGRIMLYCGGLVLL